MCLTVESSHVLHRRRWLCLRLIQKRFYFPTAVQYPKRNNALVFILFLNYLLFLLFALMFQMLNKPLHLVFLLYSSGELCQGILCFFTNVAATKQGCFLQNSGKSRHFTCSWNSHGMFWVIASVWNPKLMFWCGVFLLMNALFIPFNSCFSPFSGNGWPAGESSSYRHLLLPGGIQPLHGQGVCHAGTTADWWCEHLNITYN